jgi:hypothetical protein
MTEFNLHCSVTLWNARTSYNIAGEYVTVQNCFQYLGEMMCKRPYSSVGRVVVRYSENSRFESGCTFFLPRDISKHNTVHCIIVLCKSFIFKMSYNKNIHTIETMWRKMAKFHIVRHILSLSIILFMYFSTIIWMFAYYDSQKLVYKKCRATHMTSFLALDSYHW